MLAKMDYRDLQQLSKVHDICANQSAKELRAELAAVRDDGALRLNPEREFNAIAKLIEDGNLPFHAQPVAEADIRGPPDRVDLREYQERAWERFCDTGMVGVYWPPGAGKTFLTLYAGERIEGEKLVVVPSSTLEAQWQERIQDYCSLPSE